MRTITLTQGQEAIVDDADYERLAKYKWHAQKGRNGYYANRFHTIEGLFEAGSGGRRRKRVLVTMARQILLMCSEDRREPDHKNHNTLDNRRENLRIATRQQNMWNKSKKEGCRSGYIGVRKNKDCGGRWSTGIIDTFGKYQHIGTFDTEEQAALAYNAECLAQRGDFAVLNDVA